MPQQPSAGGHCDGGRQMPSAQTVSVAALGHVSEPEQDEDEETQEPSSHLCGRVLGQAGRIGHSRAVPAHEPS